MGQLADVKKNVVAGILEHGPKQFLALGAEQGKCFSEIRPVCPEAHRVALSQHVAALLSFLPLACQTFATTGRAYSHRIPLARLKCSCEKRRLEKCAKSWPSNRRSVLSSRHSTECHQSFWTSRDAWCRAPLRDLSNLELNWRREKCNVWCEAPKNRNRPAEEKDGWRPGGKHPPLEKETIQFRWQAARNASRGTCRNTQIVGSHTSSLGYSKVFS